MSKARRLALATLVALAGGVGVATGFVARGETEQHQNVVEHHGGHFVVVGPSCPTEDSCTIDYDGERWNITEVIP